MQALDNLRERDEGTNIVFVEKYDEILQHASLEFSNAHVCMNGAHTIVLFFSLTINTDSR